jgi:WD40 repeat protein
MQGRSIAEVLREYAEVVSAMQLARKPAKATMAVSHYSEFLQRQGFRFRDNPECLMAIAMAEPADSPIRKFAKLTLGIRGEDWNASVTRLGRPWFRRLFVPKTDPTPGLIATIALPSPANVVAGARLNGIDYVVCGCADNILRLVNLTDHSIEELPSHRDQGSEELSGFSGGISQLQVSEDGKTAITASQTGDLLMWNLEQKSFAGILDNHRVDEALTEFLRARHVPIPANIKIALTPTGHTLVGLYDQVVFRYRLEGHNVLEFTFFKMSNLLREAQSISVDPDGRAVYVLDTCPTGCSRLWRWLPDQNVLEGGFRHYISHAIFHIVGDGASAIVCGLEGHIHRISVEHLLTDGQEWNDVFAAWDYGYKMAVFTQCQTRFVATSWDGEVLVLGEVGSGGVMSEFPTLGDTFTSVAILPDQQSAVSASGSGTLRFWQLKTRAKKRFQDTDIGWYSRSRHSRGRNCLALSRNGLKCYCNDLNGGMLNLYTIDVLAGTKSCVHQTNPFGDPGIYHIDELQVSRDGKSLLIRDYPGNFIVFALEDPIFPFHTGRIMRSPVDVRDQYELFIYNMYGHFVDVPNGTLLLYRDVLLVAGSKGTVARADLKTGVSQQLNEDPLEVCCAMALDDAQRLLLLGYQSGQVGAFDLVDDRRLWLHACSDERVNDVAIDAAGRLAVAVTECGNIQTWDAHSGKSYDHWNGHAEGIVKVRFLSSNYIVTGSLDGTVAMWDASHRIRLAYYHLGKGLADLDVAQLSSNGRIVMAARCLDGDLQLFEVMESDGQANQVPAG